MSQKNVQILRQCAALLNVGDWDALLELYDPALNSATCGILPTCPRWFTAVELSVSW